MTECSAHLLHFLSHSECDDTNTHAHLSGITLDREAIYSEGTECEQVDTFHLEHVLKTLHPWVPVHIGKIIPVRVILERTHRLRWKQRLLKDE